MNDRFIIAMLATIAMSLTLPALAAEDAARCMEVEVNGQRAPSFACLTQKLTPSTNVSRARPAASLASEAIVGRASNQLGLFNVAATGHRMGNTFGTSARPQRPAAPPPASPLIPNK